MPFRLPGMAGQRGFIGVEQPYADDGGNFKHSADTTFRITFLNALQQPPGYSRAVRGFLGSEPALFTRGADQSAQQTDCRAAVS